MGNTLSDLLDSVVAMGCIIWSSLHSQGGLLGPLVGTPHMQNPLTLGGVPLTCNIALGYCVYSRLLLFTSGWGLPDPPHPFQKPTRSPLFNSPATAGIWQQSYPASSGASIYVIATPDEARRLQLAYTTPSIQHRWGLLPVFSHVCKIRRGNNDRVDHRLGVTSQTVAST